MTDYTELIRSLRNCSNNRCAPCYCGWFDKYQVDESCKEIIMWKAADAIEALQAEMKDKPWVESVQIDMLRQRIDELEETVCHCNVKENAELIARILDDDVDGKVYEMPRRGEWIKHPEVKNIYGGVYIECPFCGEKYVVQNIADEKFCRNCGADMRKMEVQE